MTGKLAPASRVGEEQEEQNDQQLRGHQNGVVVLEGNQDGGEHGQEVVVAERGEQGGESGHDLDLREPAEGDLEAAG